MKKYLIIDAKPEEWRFDNIECAVCHISKDIHDGVNVLAYPWSLENVKNVMPYYKDFEAIFTCSNACRYNLNMQKLLL